MDIQLSRKHPPGAICAIAIAPYGYVLLHRVTARGTTRDHVELTPNEARQLAAALVSEADKAETQAALVEPGVIGSVVPASLL